MIRRALPLLAASALACACAEPCLCRRSDPEHSAQGRQYRWINPLLDCDTNMEFVEIRSFKRRIQQYLTEAETAGKVTHVSVYYRDLNNGPWFGIAERVEFEPASLTKLPLLIGVLKQAESNPGLLSETTAFDRSLQIPQEQSFSSKSVLQPDTPYTLEQLAIAMISRSDNYAAIMLMRIFGAKGIEEVYGDLGVPIPADGIPVVMQVKQYAGLFRVLFNASYLSRAMSEKALGWLVQSDFKDGLAAVSKRTLVGA